MKVPLLDLRAQLSGIESELKAAVIDAIDSTGYILGPTVERFEAAVADYCGSGFGVGVSSGTDALLMALMALDVGPGDIVVTTPYSFFATAGAIARLEATPAFVDIDAATYNMDPAALREWFATHVDDAQKAKAIIPVHLYGQCCDMDPIMDIASEHGIPIIEDAAQAIGARYPSKSGERIAGSMSAMGCFSFFPSKNLGGIGDGGMIVCDDEALAERLRILRNHGANPKYYHKVIGGNFRLDAVQAAALSVKLKYLDSWHAARQENAAYYDENLNVKGLTKPTLAYSRAAHIYNQYILSVPGKRDELRTYLNDHDIGCEVYYPVAFHQQECFRYLGYTSGDFPNSEHAAAHTIAIPIYPELTQEMRDYVIGTIASFYD